MLMKAFEDWGGADNSEGDAGGGSCDGGGGGSCGGGGGD